MNSFNGWEMGDTEEGELVNNLILVDKIVEKLHCSDKPEFHVLGGAALIFNGINYSSTIDIDTANEIDSTIKEEISMFISDGASEVVILPKQYKTRLMEYKPEVFTHIKVFTLSNEDLIFTKLSSDRRKDYQQLVTTNITSKINRELLLSIIEDECCDSVLKLRIMWKLEKLGIDKVK